MGRKMLVQIEKILRQVSVKEDLPYGGFIVIIVVDFQQLPPVGDKTMHNEVNAEASFLFKNIQNVVILKQPQKKVGKSPEEVKFQQILQHWKEDSLAEQDWMDLFDLEQHLIQMMLVGINLIKCFITKIPPLNTTC